MKKNITADLILKKYGYVFETYDEVNDFIYKNKITNEKMLEKIIFENIIKYVEKGDLTIVNKFIDDQLSKIDDKYVFLSALESFLNKINIKKKLYLLYDILDNSVIREKLNQFTIDNKINVCAMDNFILNDINKNILKVFCEINNLKFETNDDIKKSQFFEKTSLDMYIREINQFRLLSKREERELFEKYKNGDMEAKNKLFNHNLRLVIPYAKYFSHNSCNNLSIQDLIQEGNLGLMKAIENFDLSYNVKLSTYAVPKIKLAISRTIDYKDDIIRVPADLRLKIKKVYKVKEVLSRKLGRDATTKEIANHLDFDEREVIDIFHKIPSTISYDEVRTLYGEDESNMYNENIIGDSYTQEDDVLDQIYLNELINLIKSVLVNERDIDILLCRYGFVDGEVWTLGKLSKKYDVSWQRIDEIEKRSLKKLKNNKKFKMFFDKSKPSNLTI